MEEGLAPLLDTPTLLIWNKVSQREAKPLLYIPSPFPLARGRGIKGDGVVKNLSIKVAGYIEDMIQ